MRVRMPPLDGIRCELCGSDPSLGIDSTWRMAGDHWQHRCDDVHPQCGHWRVDPAPQPGDPEIPDACTGCGLAAHDGPMGEFCLLTQLDCDRARESAGVKTEGEKPDS